VQVLGVGDQHQEHQQHADLPQDEHGLDHVVRGAAQRLQRLGHQLGGECPRAVVEREVAGVDLRAAVEQQRGDHPEDHPQDDPGRAEVRAVEPGGALPPGRRLPDAEHGEHGQRDQHGHREEVLEEAEHRPGADQRDVEVAPDQRPVRFDDRQEQDQEAPEREEVRQPGAGPAQQLALPEHLGKVGPQPRTEVLGASGLRLAGTDQPVQPPDAAAGDGERNQGHQHADHQADGHSTSLQRATWAEYPFYSPVASGGPTLPAPGRHAGL
jgi:hypothetical protein